MALNGLQNRCSTTELTRHHRENTRDFVSHKRTKSENGTGLAPYPFSAALIAAAALLSYF